MEKKMEPCLKQCLKEATHFFFAEHFLGFAGTFQFDSFVLFFMNYI